jgi:hypothetical protein
MAMLTVFLVVPPLPGLLGGHVPAWLGWGVLAVPAVWLADALDKRLRTYRRADA